MAINAVWGPPQSGKTTVAIDLAFALSRNGRSVCLISPELYSELAVKLGIQINREKSLSAVSKNRESLKQVVYPVDDLFFVLAVPYDYDAFEDNLSEDVAKDILKQASELFDQVIVDCPSHTESVLAAWALSYADCVLMMSGANSAAVLWKKAYTRAIQPISKRSIYVSAEINDFFDYSLLHDMLDVSPVAWLPHVENAAMTQILKRTLYQRGGKIGGQYTKGIDTICSHLPGEERETK